MDDVALIVQLRVVLRVNKEKRTTFFSNVSNFLWVKCELVVNTLRHTYIQGHIYRENKCGRLFVNKFGYIQSWETWKKKPPQGSPSYSF